MMPPDFPADVLAFYDRYSEEDRLSSGAFQLEFERTKQVLARVLPRPPLRDPAFVEIGNRDLREGQHRNETSRLDYFTTAYFHRPEELPGELADTGFSDIRVLGVEGPAGFLPDFETRWADPVTRADIIELAGLLEAEPSIVGMSAHLLAIGMS